MKSRIFAQLYSEAFPPSGFLFCVFSGGTFVVLADLCIAAASKPTLALIIYRQCLLTILLIFLDFCKFLRFFIFYNITPHPPLNSR